YPASVTVSSRRRVFGLSTNPPPAPPSSRSLLSSRLTSRTPRAPRPPRRTASIQSPSLCSQ
ncbi:hypothetical protein M9458_048962, partial [Cirrhinus mrigala]